MNTLSVKQQQILGVIRKAIDERGYAPTVREIGALVDLSSSCTVKKHLDTLEERGFLRRDRYQRTIQLMDHGQPLNPVRTVSVPLLGHVAGGAPIFAEENMAPDTLPLPTSFFSRGVEDLFALEVTGNSMRDAGIADGDIVVARKQNTAANGDIVVALLEDEATVKTYYRERDHIRLQPENPDFEPILAREVHVLGKVALAIKRF